MWTCEATLIRVPRIGSVLCMAENKDERSTCWQCHGLREAGERTARRGVANRGKNPDDCDRCEGTADGSVRCTHCKTEFRRCVKHGGSDAALNAMRAHKEREHAADLRG